MQGTIEKICSVLYLFVSIIICEQCALAGLAEPTGESNTADTLWFEVSGGLHYGSIDGFLQTPSGGNHGTTCHKRPTFDKLGINTVLSFDGSVNAHWKMHTLTAGAQMNRFSENLILNDPLISQKICFPANINVASDIRLDWYRSGYLYTFDLSPKGHKKTFFISPGVDLALLDFHYELKGDENHHVDRSYKKGTLRLLCNIDWEIIEGFYLRARGSGSLPLSNTPSIINLDLVVEKLLLSKSGTVVSAYLGVAYEKIDYKDNQDVPNHVEAEMWPLLTSGLKVRF